MYAVLSHRASFQTVQSDICALTIKVFIYFDLSIYLFQSCQVIFARFLRVPRVRRLRFGRLSLSLSFTFIGCLTRYIYLDILCFH